MSPPATSPTRPRSRRSFPPPKPRWASLDILVNNAGITRDNLFMRMKDEDWEPCSPSTLTPPSASPAPR
jgi:3-oxoacyl-[acyl-carrier protein] reductase